MVAPVAIPAVVGAAGGAAVGYMIGKYSCTETKICDLIT